MVGVVASEIVEDHWDDCFLWVDFEVAQVANIVCCAAKLACEMAVVSNSLPELVL